MNVSPAAIRAAIAAWQRSNPSAFNAKEVEALVEFFSRRLVRDEQLAGELVDAIIKAHGGLNPWPASERQALISTVREVLGRAHEITFNVSENPSLKTLATLTTMAVLAIEKSAQPKSSP
jgi:hypothetical protein